MCETLTFCTLPHVHSCALMPNNTGSESISAARMTLHSIINHAVSMQCCSLHIIFTSRPQFCVDCHQYFCAQCVTNTRSPYQCRRCEVFKCDVMKRRQLEQLSLNDLKYYIRTRNIDAPLSAAKSQLLEWVLSHQAKQLSERARCALEELTGTPGLNYEDVDTSLLEPHSSRYSSSAQTPQGSLSRGSTAEIRSEIQHHVHLEKV